MKITTDGLVIWENRTGEADRVLTLLTPRGVVNAYARNSLRPTNKLTSPTAMLSYSEFELFSGKNMFTVDDALSKTRFVRLSSDVRGYALAAYFCELVKLLAPVEDDATDFLSLMLNSLWLLNESAKPHELIKCVFELKAAQFAGYCPDLDECRCGKTNDKRLFFDIANGTWLCERCASIDNIRCNASAGVLEAARHIIRSDTRSAFSFTLSDEAMKTLCPLCEFYIRQWIDHSLATLDFYNSVS